MLAVMIHQRFFASTFHRTRQRPCAAPSTAPSTAPARTMTTYVGSVDHPDTVTTTPIDPANTNPSVSPNVTQKIHTRSLPRHDGHQLNRAWSHLAE